MITKVLMKWSIAVSLVVLFVGLSPVSVNAQTFVDEEFDSLNWISLTVTTSGSGATDVQLSDTLGNPDPYRAITHNLGVAICVALPPANPCSIKQSSVVVSVHLNTSATWDPSPSGDGAIASIDYSEDAITLQAADRVRGALVGMALEQDGVLYATSTFIGSRNSPFTSNDWLTQELSGLTEDDFFKIRDPLDFGESIFVGGHPNFSGGGEITFGYARRSSHTGESSGDTRITGIDNWKVTVHPPVFTHAITSVFPNEEFLTCQIGHFDLPPVASAASVPHSWYVRPRQNGTLTIKVVAFSVNGAESGHIQAELFDGPTSLDSVTVPHPARGGVRSSLISYRHR